MSRFNNEKMSYSEMSIKQLKDILYNEKLDFKTEGLLIDILLRKIYDFENSLKD